VAGGGGAEGGVGPSLDELTLEYAPPEVIFSSRCAGGVLKVLGLGFRVVGNHWPTILTGCFEAHWPFGSATRAWTQAALQLGCMVVSRPLWQVVGALRGALAPAWMS
jgi:hypothetical protein